MQTIKDLFSLKDTIYMHALHKVPVITINLQALKLSPLKGLKFPALGDTG